MVGIALEPVAISTSPRGLSVFVWLVLVDWDTLREAGSGMSDIDVLGMVDVVGLATDGVKP